MTSSPGHAHPRGDAPGPEDFLLLRPLDELGNPRAAARHDQLGDLMRTVAPALLRNRAAAAGFAVQRDRDAVRGIVRRIDDDNVHCRAAPADLPRHRGHVVVPEPARHHHRARLEQVDHRLQLGTAPDRGHVGRKQPQPLQREPQEGFLHRVRDLQDHRRIAVELHRGQRAGETVDRRQRLAPGQTAPGIDDGNLVRPRRRVGFEEIERRRAGPVARAHPGVDHLLREAGRPSHRGASGALSGLQSRGSNRQVRWSRASSARHSSSV